MGKCNNCNNHQNQQPRPQRPEESEKKTKTRLEIHIPPEEEYVQIPVDEYAELIAEATTLDIIVRWMKDRARYSPEFGVMLNMIGEKEADA